MYSLLRYYTIEHDSIVIPMANPNILSKYEEKLIQTYTI